MNKRVLFFRKVVSVLLLIGFVTASKTMNQKQYRIIKSYMDESADPCMDYYQYTCGNWETIHEDDTFEDTMEFVDYQINEEFTHILKSRKRNAHRHFIRQVLAYYSSCKSVEEFVPMLYVDWMKKQENITWPSFVDNGNNSTVESYNWLNMLATMRKYGFNGILLSETVLQKRDDAQNYLIDLDRPVPDDEFIPLKYREFQIIAKYVGIKKQRKRQRIWEKIQRFETKLLELFEIEDENGFEELKISNAIIPKQISDYIKIILEVDRLDSNMNITISNRPYMVALMDMLQNYDGEFICSYLTMRFLWFLNYSGPTDFDKHSCVSNVREHMPLAMSWLHEQHNPLLSQEGVKIKRIFDNIRKEFLKTLLDNTNNFDNKVLEYLTKKLNNMQLKVGNIPRNGTVIVIEDFYRKLTLSESDFYANHLKLLRYNTQKVHERLRSPLPLDVENFYYLEDTSTTATSTPYFLQRKNVVIMPLTLLHFPIYHPQLHDVFKYSLIGFLLAHEITHGFDDSGLDYDQYGNIQVTSEVIKENSIFDKNFDCLFTKNPKVIDEKIADVSGLRWAFKAYFSNSTISNLNLPWANMTQRQLFLRNFALFFCGNFSSDRKLANSTHGTWRSRLNDAVSQFHEFGEIFQCPIGSPMNPVRKCQLWR